MPDQALFDLFSAPNYDTHLDVLYKQAMSRLTGNDLRQSGGRLEPKRMVMATCCQHSWRKQGVKRWAFSYADIAALFRMEEGSVRNLVCSNELEPANLEEVCEFWLKRRTKVKQ